MKIKVCGMKYGVNLQEVEDFQPDYLGLIFYEKSERCMKRILSSSDLKRIRIKKIGVFVNQSLEEIEVAITDFSLDAVQLHGNETPEFCTLLKGKDIKVIKAFAVNDEFNFEDTKEYKGCCDYFLFDTKGNKKGGNGIAFNWNILKNYDQQIPFFLSGGIGPENIWEVLELKDLNIYCIDINSKVEHFPGFKNTDKVKETIALIRTIAK